MLCKTFNFSFLLLAIFQKNLIGTTLGAMPCSPLKGKLVTYRMSAGHTRQLTLAALPFFVLYLLDLSNAKPFVALQPGSFMHLSSMLIINLTISLPNNQCYVVQLIYENYFDISADRQTDNIITL